MVNLKPIAPYLAADTEEPARVMLREHEGENRVPAPVVTTFCT